MIFSPVFLFLLLPCHSLQTTANEKKTQSGNYHPSPLVKSSPTKRETLNLNANKSLPSSAKPTHYLISNQNLSSSTKPSDVSNQRTSKKEASPSPAQHPIKVLISDACIQRDSTKDITNTSQVQVQSQELDLERGSPLVLTHQINLVPGSCGGCEAEFTSLQNRLERLEKEVSTLKRKCADGAACSLRSDGNECPNDCSDQGRCKDGKCVCFPGFNGYDCGSPSCLSDCNNNGKCVNGQCECDKGFSGPDCANKSCPGDCHNQGQCLKGKCMCHHGFTGPDCSIAPSSSLHLRSKDVTDASVTLLWTLPAIQHSAYHITFKSQRAGDENITAKVGGRLSNFTQTGLAAGQKYKVSIRGERDGKMDPESTTEFTTAQSSPLHLRSRDITDGSVTLYWTLPSVSYSTYHITFKSQKEEDEKITAEVTGGLSSFTQTGLAAGQKYKVSIRGKKDGKMGPESSIEITTAPSGSIQLRSRDITDSSVALYWTLPSVSYNTYHITFKSQRDGDKEITANIAGRLSSYTQTGLAAGQKYKVSIRGEKAGKMGPVSSTELTTAPSGFVHLRSRDITDSSVTLYWTLPSVSYNTYHITFKSQREGARQITANIAGRLSSYTQTGLAAGQKYKVSIRGERDEKMGPESTIEFTTAPSGSIPLQSRDITDSSVTLYWALPSVSYNTYHITFKSQREGDKPITTNIAGRLSSYIQTGLAAGQKYKVSIRGERDGKIGPESTIEFTTAPSGSIQVRSKDITDSSVTLYWTLPSVSYNTYHITFKSQRAGDKQISANIAGRLSSYTQTGLAAGQKYKVSIRGERDGKMGPESSIEITTAPSGSVQLRSRDITDSSVTLYWTLPSVSYNTYHITFKSQREGDKQITATTAGRLSSYTQTGLAAGQKYKVSIRGERDGKMGPESTTEFTTAPSGSIPLRSRDITDSSVTLYWTLPSVSYNTYHITFKSQREEDRVLTAEVAGRLSSYTQTGLAAGQKYRVSIRGKKDGKMGPESSTEITTAPSGSIQLRSRDITDSSVTLYWTLPSVSYNTYHITFKSQNEQKTAVIEGRLSSFTQTGLTAGQKYKVSITGERAGRMGPESTMEFTTAPSGSVQLRSRDITDSSVTLYWTLPSVSYNTYHITFKSQREGDKQITAKVGGRLSSFTQTGLAAAQKYRVSIRGERDGKMGPESSTEFTTAPSGSLLLRSRDVTESSVTLFWMPPSVMYNTYHITFKSQREGDKQITAKVGGRLSSLTQTGLAAGQKYKVSIRGERDGKMGPESTIEFTTAPSGSVHLRSRDITDSSVTLYWTLPSVSYNTYHITFKSQKERDERITAQIGGRLSSFTQTGLAAGQKYRVSIRGEKDGKMGPESSTEITTAPSGSIHLRSRDITDSSVTLYWTLPSVSYNTYHITFKSQKEGDEKITTQITGRLSSYTQTGLAAGQKYKVSIRGERDGKMGPESTIEITTAPSGSLHLRSRDITDSSVTLYWTLPSVPYNTYHITFKSQREGDKQITAKVGGRLSSYTQTGLAAGQKYRVSIRGERAGKMGPESSIEFTTAPSGSLHLRSRDVTDSSVTLYWPQPSVSYNTYHITFKSQREGDKPVTAKVAGRLSSYTQTGLAAGQKYKVSIRGERDEKMGPESTTEFTTAPSGSIQLRSRDITDFSVTLYWTLPSVSYNTYHITFKSQREGDRVITAEAAGRLSSYTQTGLAAGQKYKVSIRGKKDGKMGPESSTEFTTAPSGSVQLRSRDITDSSVTLYWTLPSVSYNTYHITFKSQREGDKQITATTAGKLSSYTQTGLAAGQKYKVSIRGEKDGKMGPESTIEFTTAPSGSIQLRSRDITDSSVTLYWTLPSVSYSTYHITFKSQREGDRVITAEAAGRLSSYTQTGLAAGQKYKVSIRGKKDGKMGPESSTEITTAPSGSIQLRSRDITESSVTLFWTLPSVTYNTYHITFKSQREGDKQITANIAGRLSSYIQTRLAAGQKYRVSIRGERAGKMGPESSIEFTTAPSGAIQLRSRDTTDSSITLYWALPSVPYTTYHITFRSQREGDKQITANIAGRLSSYTQTGLAAGQKYKVSIRGERAGKMGPESTMEFMTAASGSVHFRSRDITDSSATLYWTLPSVSYNTYHITFKSQREGDKPITANIAGRLSSYTQTGLAAGQKYKVSIRGERDGKMGPESTTEFTTAPSGSIQLRSRDITDSSITLYWTLPSVQYSSYHITFKSQREGDKQITANIAGRLSSYTQTGLAAGQKYKVSIRGERDRKLGPESTIEFTTAPSGFVHLRSRDITESSVTLFWTLPSVSYNTYHITFKSQRDGDKPITTNIAGRLSSYTQTGLAAGQKYKVSIRGERDGKMGPESTIEFTTASSFSLHLGTRHITDSSVTLYWTLPSVPYTNYHITFQSQREGDERITAKVGGRLSSYTQTGLAAGQKYKVSIRGERAGKMGPESSTEFTTYISSPRNLHILKTTRTSILVQWESPVVDIDSYRISIAPNVTEAEEGKKEIQESTLPPDTDAANIDGLEEGRLYDITLVALKGRSQSQPIRVQAMPGDGKNIFTKVIVETVTAKVPREGDMIEEKKSSDKAELDKTLFHKKNEERQREELKEKSSPKVGDSSTAKQGMYEKTDITSLDKKQKTVVSSDTAIDRKTHTGSGTRKTAQDEKRNGQASEKQTATSGRVESTKVMLPDSSLDSKQHTKLQPRPDVKATVTVKQESEARTRSKTDSLEAQARYSHTTQISSSSKESKTDSKYLTHSVKDTSSKSLSVKEVPEQTSLVEENAARTPTGKSVKKLAGHGYSVDSTTGLKTNSTVMKVDTKTTTTKVELTRGDKITTHKMSGSQGDVTVAGDNRPTGSVKTGTTQVNGTDRIHGSLGNGTARYSTKTGVGNGTDQTVKQRSESSQNVTVTLRTVSTTGTESRPAVAEGKTVFKTAGEAKANHTVSEEEKERKKGKAFTNREDTDKRPESSAKQVSKTEFSHKITTVQVSQSRSEGAGGTHVVTVRNETRVITQGNQGVRSNHSDIHTDSIISSTAQINRNHTSGSKIRHSHAKMTHNDTSSQTGLNITSPQTHSKDITETGRHQINVTSSSTRNAGIALTSVEVQNVTSRGFILIWEAPRGLFQNFVVTRREYVMGSTTEEEQEEEEEEEEIEEEEEEDINEEEISVTQESENKEEISSVSSNTTDSHRKSSEGSRHESPTKAHSRTTGRVTSKKFKRISQVVPGNARSLTFRNLRPHTRYSLTLFGKGSGLRSKIYRFFITTGPESPSELLFSNVTDSSLSVSWTKPKSSVTGFKVTYTHTEDGKSMSMSVDSQHSSVTLSQLSPASSYEVSVMSVLGQEESDPIRGLVITVPDPPTGLQAVNVTDTKALLQWKASLATVDRYIIVYGSENAPDTTVKVPGNTVEQQLKGLRTGTFYTVTITSQLGSLQSTRTTTTFTTAGGSGIIGEGIQELAVGQLTPRSAVLSWKSPRTLVTSYKITYQKAGQITKEVVLPSTVTKFKLTGLSPLSKYNVRVQGERKGQYVTSISVELTTGSLRFPFPTDCSQELLNGMQQSGEVEVFPSGKQGKPVRVYCDMETDGGGWTVFQRRMNGETDFFRGWSDYSYGFGNLSGEFWLGNEQIHNLTSLRPMALRVDLRAGADSAHAYYSFFYVDSHKRHYTLRVSGYSGNAGDSMRYHNGRPFSTRDKDSNPSITRCATSYRGGWWYKNCHEANLNGLYNTSSSHQGVIWTDWKGKDFSIPFTEMKLRPASFPSRTHS